MTDIYPGQIWQVEVKSFREQDLDQDLTPRLSQYMRVGMEADVSKICSVQLSWE